jgi:hypothetical protein
MSHSSSLLVSYTEAYLIRLELLLRTGRFPSMTLREPLFYLFRVTRRIYEYTAMQFLWQPMGRNSSLSWGNIWHTVFLVGTRQPGGKESSLWLVLLGPNLNSRSNLSVRKADQFYHFIRRIMGYAYPEIRPESVSVRIRVSLHCDQKADSTGSGDSIFRQPHQISDWGFVPKLADAVNPLVRHLGRHLCRLRATWSPPTSSRAEETLSRPAEAVPQEDGEAGTTGSLQLLAWRASCSLCFLSGVKKC